VISVRYVLFCHEETPDPDDLRRIANAPGVKIIDQSVTRVLLIEASREASDRLRLDLKRWTISEESVYSSPHLPFKKR
jgi:hypothetical protein